MVAQIQHFVPGLFTRFSKTGTTFQCTDSFVRKFLHQELGWSERAATRAAQKVPIDAPMQIRHSFLRQALVTRNYNIVADLRVNMDQQNTKYQMGSDSTWAPTGSKQVAVAGNEDKRAFTLVVGVSASGTLLPFQAIWDGKLVSRSLPKPPQKIAEEADKLGFRMVLSCNDTYWSTFDTMCDYVTNILVPYFDTQKRRLGLPKEQECLFQIDVWAVHRSVAFRTWINTTYPYIIVDYVPGGCTGLFQPCDLGIQRPVKIMLKRAQHADLVREALEKLEGGTKPEELKLDARKGIVRDRTVGWMIQAYHGVNKPEIVKKVRMTAWKWET